LHHPENDVPSRQEIEYRLGAHLPWHRCKLERCVVFWRRSTGAAHPAPWVPRQCVLRAPVQVAERHLQTNGDAWRQASPAPTHLKSALRHGRSRGNNRPHLGTTKGSAPRQGYDLVLDPNPYPAPNRKGVPILHRGATGPKARYSAIRALACLMSHTTTWPGQMNRRRYRRTRAGRCRRSAFPRWGRFVLKPDCGK